MDVAFVLDTEFRAFVVVLIATFPPPGVGSEEDWELGMTPAWRGHFVPAVEQGLVREMVVATVPVRGESCPESGAVLVGMQVQATEPKSRCFPLVLDRGQVYSKGNRLSPE